MKRFRPLIIEAVVILLLVITLIVLVILKSNPEIAEAMTRGPARIYGFIAGAVSSAIPFVSLTELLFINLFLLTILLIGLFIFNLVKKQPIKAFSKLLSIAIIALAVIDTYHFSCEAAYNRKEMPLPYYENDVVREEYSDIYNYYASDLAACLETVEFKENGDVKKGLSFNEIVKEVKKAYQTLDDPYFSPYFGSVKRMMSSVVYREFQITGVTFAAFGEANINTLDVTIDIPYTVAHELAHTKGVMREDDANILAFYICLNSEHPYLRLSAYSRYFYLIANMGSGSYLTKEERAALVKVDLSAYYKLINFKIAYWEEHDLLEEIADWINNLYIKTSGDEDGTYSYEKGTEIEYDPTAHRITTYNPYHKLFFEKYYR